MLDIGLVFLDILREINSFMDFFRVNLGVIFFGFCGFFREGRLFCLDFFFLIMFCLCCLSNLVGDIDCIFIFLLFEYFVKLSIV